MRTSGLPGGGAGGGGKKPLRGAATGARARTAGPRMSAGRVRGPGLAGGLARAALTLGRRATARQRNALRASDQAMKGWWYLGEIFGPAIHD